MSDKAINDNHTDTEQLILKAAEDEFLAKGFDGARTTAIAERAGVTHAMLHYYFRTKEKLFDRVMETKTAQMKTVMFGFIGEDNLPITECVEKGMRRHFEYLRANEAMPIFMINELRRPNSKAVKHLTAKKDAAETITQSLQAALDRGTELGECSKTDALMLMLDIISLNIFPFVATPIVDTLFDTQAGNRDEFLNRRLEENIATILKKLKP